MRRICFIRAITERSSGSHALPKMRRIIDNLGPACAATELILCTFPVCERKTELGQDKIGGAHACEAPRAMGRLIASEKRYWTVGPMIFAAENSAQSAHVGSRRGWGWRSASQHILTSR